MERAMLCLILVWQCWLLYIIDRSWWFPGVVALAVGMGHAVRRIRDMQWRARTWWGLGGVVILAVVLLPVRPSSSIPFWVISGELMIPIIRGLLLWLALLVLRPCRQIHERAVEFALVIAIFGLCMFRPAFDQQRDFYWVLAAAIGITLLVIGRPSPGATVVGTPSTTALRRVLLPPGARWVLVAANFVVLGTWGMTGILREVADRIQLQVDQVAESSELIMSTGHRYLHIATLDNVSAEKRSSPLQVALRVYCEVQPGYLRGMAYESLEGDRWLNSSQTHRVVIPLNVENNLSQLQPLASSDPCFRIQPVNCDQWRQVEVRNDPSRGKAYFSPLDAAFVQGDGRHASMDAHRVIRSGPSTRSPYRFFVPNCSVRETLTDPQRQHLLAIPGNLSTEARSTLSRIVPRDESTRAKIAAVEAYFHEQYEYSLEPIAFAPRQDRLSQFITNGSRGHCEFFASSAVIALRLLGVPTRYVIGYAVSELEDENGEFWVARNRDCHAWAEAYSAEEQRWLVVEATPGMDVSRNIWDQDAQADAEDEVILDVNQRDRFGGSRWGWFLPSFTADSIARFSVILSGLVSIIILVVIVVHRRAGPRSRYGDAEAGRALRVLDRKLRRRGVVRASDETLKAFAERLRQDDSGEAWIRDAAFQYESYMQRRYAC